MESFDVSNRRLPKWNRAKICCFAAVVTLLAAGCGSEPATPVPVAVNQEDLTLLPQATTFATVPDAAKDSGAPATGKVVHPKDEIVVYQSVGGKAIARLPSIQVGSPTWVPVLSEQDDWAEILLPARPNAAVGWVHLNPAVVETAQNDYTIKVDRAAFSLELDRAGKPVGNWTVGTGKPEFPTPAGRAFLLASIEETVNKYSPIVLPLSAHSESHETFGGGPGTVGIHTWPNDSYVGKANSDGCIRVPQAALDELVKVPLGAIVTIV
ncbi:L,D-transpeptidase [Amycolatopsis sp. H20-H5]|uniref:L,D-transpeptidase n=1 Tax=Amycolatopsis sp. H20-H5 TaxID=3046309 RepID=UPI002DB6B235|nr:L,D-transpeptidase [Amycolatopsis sp. H20-H5]MEC3975124.1 L,D-transpeptidase [Amycolatopsis sp. H20-H5]